MTKPAEVVLGCLGSRPQSEQALVARVMSHCALSFDWATVATKNAIVTLVTEGKVEQIAQGVSAYRLTQKACITEGESPTVAKGAKKGSGGYKQYHKPEQDDDATPHMGSKTAASDGDEAGLAVPPKAGG